MKYEVFRQYVWAIHPLSSGGEVDCTNRLYCSIYPQPCLLYVGKWINGHEQVFHFAVALILLEIQVMSLCVFINCS